MKMLKTTKISGRGAPIVFIHGLLDSSESYVEIAQKMPRPAVLIDLPGFGQSDFDESLEGFNGWVKAVRKTIRREIKGRYFLVGHSLGGAIASSVAEKDKESVKGLVLISSAGYARLPIAQPLSLPLSERILLETAPRVMASERLIKSFYWSVFSHGGKIDDDLLKRLVSERYRAIPGSRAAMRVIADLSRHPFKENSYQGPVTVIWGDRDFLTPRKASLERLSGIFPDASVHVLKDTGHHPQDEKRAAVTRILKKATAF